METTTGTEVDVCFAFIFQPWRLSLAFSVWKMGVLDLWLTMEKLHIEQLPMCCFHAPSKTSINHYQAHFEVFLFLSAVWYKFKKGFYWWWQT